MPTSLEKMRDVLTKYGWRYDKKNDFWTRPKRQGHIKITSEGWIHNGVVDVNRVPDDVEKRGVNEKDLEEYLKSLESERTRRFPIP